VTTGHIFFIPVVLLVGVILGFVLGGRAARNAQDIERRRAEEREKVRAERAARKAAQ
jgi:hypothetical protein